MRRLDLVGLRDVGGNEVGIAARGRNLCNQALAIRGAPVGGYDSGATPGERECGGTSDAASGSRNDGHLADELRHPSDLAC